MIYEKYRFPVYTRLERIVDACVHAAGLTFSVAAAAVLLIAAFAAMRPAGIAGAIVYCAGLMGMFAASAAYNLVTRHGLKEILRRIDHSAIFVMIAGSYTPFAIAAGGSSGTAVLAAVWAIALLGVTLRLCFPRRFETPGILLYLAQGWLILVAFGPMTAALPPTPFWLLVAGGIVYTLGVPFHLMERMRFHNAVWHLFVLGGAVCQFTAVHRAVTLA